jgi:hypothetical protein
LIGGDEILHSEKEILAHASDYYRNLLGHAEKPIFSLDPECWTQEEKLTEEENEALIRPFSLEELKKTIFQWRQIQLLGLITCQWSFIRKVGRLSSMTYLTCLLSFGNKNLT